MEVEDSISRKQICIIRRLGSGLADVHMKLISSSKTQKMISLAHKCLSNKLRGSLQIPTVSKPRPSSHLRMSQQEKENARKR